MARILTLFLTLHWTAAFALLAAVSVSGAGEGLPAATLFGIAISEVSPLSPGDPLLSAGLALGFAFVSALFLWAFLTILMSHADMAVDRDETTRLAFGTATGMLTVLLVASALGTVTGHFAAVALQLAALLASYMAIHAEQGTLKRHAARERDAPRPVAREIAAGAAQAAMLARLSERAPDAPSGREG